MTVKELKKALKGYGDDDEVFMVGDWEKVEDGMLTDLRALKDVTSQIEVVDMGLDFEENRQVLLCFDEP